MIPIVLTTYEPESTVLCEITHFVRRAVMHRFEASACLIDMCLEIAASLLFLAAFTCSKLVQQLHSAYIFMIIVSMDKH